MVVTAGGDTRERTFPGKVEAAVKAELAFQVGGLIVELPVKEGQRVKKGDLIGRLREDDFRARLKTVQGELEKARAALKALQAGERPEERQRREAQVRAASAKLANARSEHNRDRRLLPKGAVSPEQVERSRTILRVAQEEYESAKQFLEKGEIARKEDIKAKEAEVLAAEGRVVGAKIQLDDCTLRAPFDGVIARRLVEPNENVKPKAPVVRFQDVDEVRVAVDVPEAFMSSALSRSDIVEVLAEFTGAPGRQFPVRIVEVAQEADPTTRTFPVRVGMKSPTDIKLRPGMTATVALTYRRASVLRDLAPILVPIAAVSKGASGDQVVWVIGADQAVAPRPVQLGEATGGRVEVLTGLDPGDRIAVAGVTQLREGMKVRDLGDALGGS
jgi:RND family efflux transporter MFP subunit